MSDIAIKVENISKKYQIGENKTYPTLRDKLMELPNRLFKGPKKTKEFWALKDVSFEVKKGEVVGIIGRNGAGKSTMLKILARITEPTSGKITMYGRVASMLEVGTGFNPELTGRENIYLNGSIIGMKKSEIEQKFEDIVAFSGVEKFLDTPVKHYSSGMYVRLAFAVAAHLDADILLVDEVLAVGDAEFQKKCLGKMSDLAESGRTVIFVSHNIETLRKLCTHAILLENGELKLSGTIFNAIKEYSESSRKAITDTDIKKSNKVIVITSLSVIKRGDNTTLFKIGIHSKEKIDAYVALGIDNRSTRLATLSSKFYKRKLTIGVGKQWVTCEAKNLSFVEGVYTCSIFIGDDYTVYEYIEKGYELNIQSILKYPNPGILDSTHGPVLVDQKWDVIS